MSKLLKFLKPYVGAVFAILCVLIIQAYCDLSLPTYTSDIVNVGIQQGGISETVPEEIGKEGFDKLLLFVASDRQDTVKDAYTASKKDYDYNGKVYTLKKSVRDDSKKLDTLSGILGRPMLLVSGFESDSDMTKKMQDEMKSQMKSQMQGQVEAQVNEQIEAQTKGQDLPEAAKEQMKQQAVEQAQSQLPDVDSMSVFDIFENMEPGQRDEAVAQIEKNIVSMPETMIEQAATTYIKNAYSNIGINTDDKQNNYILLTGGKMLALAAIGMMASILVGLLASRVGASVGRGIRGDVFKKVVGFSNGEFDKFSTASLITRSTNDIQQIQMLTVIILRMVLYAPIMAIGGIWKVFNTNADMSWIIGLAVGLILCVVVVLFVVVMPKFKTVQNLVDRLNLVSREILTGLPVIRAFSTEKYEEKRFDKANMDLTRVNLFVNRAMTFMMPTMMLIMNGVTVLIVWSGGHNVNDGTMQVGDMMAFIQYTMQIIMSFLMICMISVMLPRAAVSAVRVDEVLRSSTLIHDPEDAEDLPYDGKGEITFDHVSFRYPGAEEDVLHNLTFTAKPGQTTAIIGSTGSGKTTLVNLIPRFYDVTEGQVLIDGKDVRSITQHELRNQLGFVPQKGILFSGNIASNIMYGNPGGSEEEMREAARIAQATEFIESKK